MFVQQQQRQQQQQQQLGGVWAFRVVSLEALAAAAAAAAAATAAAAETSAAVATRIYILSCCQSRLGRCQLKDMSGTYLASILGIQKTRQGHFMAIGTFSR